MLPEAITAMVGRNAFFAVAGTRDDERVPRSHRVWGIRLGQDASVRFLVPPYGAHDLKACAVADRDVALTLAELPSHESYQLKGPALEVVPPTPEELAYFQSYKVAIVAILVAGGFPEPVASAWLQQPALTVHMRVKEAYVQTPGPGAGRRVWPEEEA